jgi:tRNA A22 N-methylase
LEEKKRQLKVLNAQLSEEMDVDEELPAFLAGEKFMRTVQNELEEKMERTLEDIEELLTRSEASTEEKMQALRHLAEQLRTVLADIRCIVYEKPR